MGQNQLTLDMFLEMDNADKKPVKKTPIEDPSRKKTYPSQIIYDFNQFMDYISQNTILLIDENEFIPSGHAAALNDRMSFQQHHLSGSTQQNHYSYIHFFYLLALKSHLVEKKASANGQTSLHITERWSVYIQFTPAEKYFLLLETFWTDMNWEELIPGTNIHVHLMLPDVFQKLLRNNTHTIAFDEHQLMTNLISHWNAFPLFLDWLGIWSCSYLDQQSAVNTFPQSITLTGFGVKILPILIKSRPLEQWNLPLRQSYKKHNQSPRAKTPSQQSEPFYQAFTSLFFRKDLNRTLPRKNP